MHSQSVGAIFSNSMFFCSLKIWKFYIFCLFIFIFWVGKVRYSLKKVPKNIVG